MSWEDDDYKLLKQMHEHIGTIADSMSGLVEIDGDVEEMTLLGLLDYRLTNIATSIDRLTAAIEKLTGKAAE